ncbi:hypothetical protein [Brevundimonas sp.]|jgi:hypothetical protein|uniref:hypothetical protein n=1 Tax=Brevundimonas sp. TaxID=1871086 RepID=UPI0037C0E833
MIGIAHKAGQAFEWVMSHPSPPRSDTDRIAELERLLFMQQGQLIALLSLEVSRVLRTPEDRELIRGVCVELAAAQPDPDTPLGAGYLSILDALTEATDDGDLGAGPH